MLSSTDRDSFRRPDGSRMPRRPEGSPTWRRPEGSRTRRRFERADGESSRRAGLLIALVIMLPMALAAQEPAVMAPIVAMPQDSTTGTDDLYYLDLGSGALAHVDQLRRDPSQVRAKRLSQNVFQEIGRPADQPAAAGEILLAPIHTAPRNARAALFVEASTGFVAYYEQLGKAGAFGRIITVIGRPFTALAASDGNFALLMRHDSDGKTVGAYLYHAGSGRALYLRGLNRLDTDAPTAAVTDFPSLGGITAAAELQVFDRTTGYLVANAADGSLRFLDLSGDSVTVRDATVGLFPTFSAEHANPAARRMTAVPIRDDRETTTHVLFVDTATGDLAMLAGVEDPGRKLVTHKLGANLYGVLGTTAGAGWRIVAAVPGVTGNGATSGVWLIDSLTRRIALVENPRNPGSAAVHRVRISR